MLNGHCRAARRRGLGMCLVALAALAGVLASATGASAAGGELTTFGLNNYGQLGTTAASGAPPALVTLPGATGSVAQVASGTDHTLAVTSTGQLYAFGENDCGQLGIATNSGTTTPNPTPALVTLPGATGTVARVAAGTNFSLVVTTTGQLYAFGCNGSGQLGTSSNYGTSNANSTPKLVNLPGISGTVSQVAGGGGQSLVITTSGQLYSFGYNYFGQLGTTTNNEVIKPPYQAPTTVSLPSGSPAEVAAGDDYSLVMTSGGQLYSFGVNLFGQLGVMTNSGNTAANPAAMAVTLSGATGTLTQIAAGSEHSLALTSSGQLYAFGYNYSGQLGSTTNNETYKPNPVPTQVTGISGTITNINVDPASSLAANSSGQLFSFGQNSYAELGRPANEQPNPTPETVSVPGPVLAIGHSEGFSSAVIVEPEPAPTVTKLSPKKGPSKGKTTVTITGTNFYGVTAVKFGSVASPQVVIDSPTSISAESPASSTGTVEVTVVSSNGNSAKTAKDRFSFEAPTVTSVNPSSGSTAGAYKATVDGSGFALGSATSFKFGKGVASSVDCTSTSSCTMLVPAAANTGTVYVIATVGKKSSKKEPPGDQFTYN